MSEPLATGDVAVLREQVVASLRRLGTDSVDLMQMHWPAEDDTALEVYWQALLDMKREGLFRAVGLSNFDVDQLEVAEALGHVDSLQPPFSLIDRRAAADVIPWCAAHETAVICYSPMQSGLLTGAFTRERVEALPDDDWRSSDDDFTVRLDANLALVDQLRPIAERHGASLAEVAVAWTLAWPGVTGAIVGARRPDQIDGWIGAGSLALTPDDLAEIAEAVTTTGAGEGPASLR
jgi:aryl-alcohol dehydrogenase-like predicted oxidoreductase